MKSNGESQNIIIMNPDDKNDNYFIVSSVPSNPLLSVLRSYKRRTNPCCDITVSFRVYSQLCQPNEGGCDYYKYKLLSNELVGKTQLIFRKIPPLCYHRLRKDYVNETM